MKQFADTYLLFTLITGIKLPRSFQNNALQISEMTKKYV